jgi:hypothetical protein
LLGFEEALLVLYVRGNGVDLRVAFFEQCFVEHRAVGSVDVCQEPLVGVNPFCVELQLHGQTKKLSLNKQRGLVRVGLLAALGAGLGRVHSYQTYRGQPVHRWGYLYRVTVDYLDDGYLLAGRVFGIVASRFGFGSRFGVR